MSPFRCFSLFFFPQWYIVSSGDRPAFPETTMLHPNEYLDFTSSDALLRLTHTPHATKLDAHNFSQFCQRVQTGCERLGQFNDFMRRFESFAATNRVFEDFVTKLNTVLPKLHRDLENLNICIKNARLANKNDSEFLAFTKHYEAEIKNLKSLIDNRVRFYKAQLGLIRKELIFFIQLINSVNVFAKDCVTLFNMAYREGDVGKLELLLKSGQYAAGKVQEYYACRDRDSPFLNLLTASLHTANPGLASPAWAEKLNDFKVDNLPHWQSEIAAATDSSPPPHKKVFLGNEDPETKKKRQFSKYLSSYRSTIYMLNIFSGTLGVGASMLKKTAIAKHANAF